MALITDPDLLNQGIEVDIDTVTLTVTLNKAGNLSDDGVTLKALYSFLKEEWKEDSTLIKFDFPMTPITDEQMQIGVSSRNNGWNWGDLVTRELIRTGGWQEVSAAGVVLNEWAGVISLGTLEAGTQVYYQREIGGVTDDFVLDGVVNQAVHIYSAPVEDDFDYRSYLKLFAREQGNVYAAADLATIGVTTMTYQAYRFPLATAVDLKITADDVDIDSDSDGIPDEAPYSGMSITYYDIAQSRNIGGVNYNFGIIIDGNSATAEEIYEFVQFQLRQDLNINDDSPPNVIGKTADELLVFVGDTLRTRPSTNAAGGGTGVFIDNFLTSDINRLEFTDNTSTVRIFPFTANLTLSFSITLQSDSASIYRVFFTNDDAGDNTGRDFGTTTAIIPHTNINTTTVSRARNSNITTIITADPHQLSIGDVVEVSGVGGTGYNGYFVVLTVPNGTTFTYSNLEANESTEADTGGTIFKSMGGLIGGSPSVQLGYDFDTNVQRGAGSDGEEAPITVVAIGLGGAQYVLATGNILRSTVNAVALVAPIERNYENPV
jgi:hypothetical protein